MPPAKKRGLADLFVIGKEKTFDDGRGEPITVWVQKLNSDEIDLCLSRANAARAMVDRYADDPDSLEYLDVLGESQTYDRDVLVEISIQDDLQDFRMHRTAELAADEKWAGENDNLAAMVAAWEGDPDSGLLGLKDVYAEGNESTNPLYPDALACYTLLDAFDKEVDVLVDEEAERLRGDAVVVSLEELQNQVARKALRRKASSIFMVEFQRACLWQSLRDSEDHTVLLFKGPDDMKALQDELAEQLQSIYNELEVSSLQGKESPGNPDSSVSAEQPATPVTELSSGLAAVAV